jgi:orotate phosphoribosyltransferase
MQAYKEDFIKFLVKSGALKFGDFTLKSGRKCPYFLNMGSFYKGSAVSTLANYYAKAIKANISDLNVIFGPAYKGIPLAVAATSEYYKEFGEDISYSYNRKEAKDHGEGGMIVGCPINAESKIVIVDDVMTAGTALRESLDILNKLGPPKIVGVLIAVDRMEKGQGEKSATQEIKDAFGITVYSIVTIADILEYLYNKPVDGVIYIDDEKKSAVENYRKEYGVSN